MTIDPAAPLDGTPLAHVPHASAIGMRVISAEKGNVLLALAYAPHLVGDPDTGVISGGVITSLLDNGSGIATMLSLGTPRAIATLDLRIDYMRAAVPGRNLYARCRLTRRTRAIAFVSGICFDDNEDDPVATSVATFMLGSNDSRALKEPELAQAFNASLP